MIGNLYLDVQHSRAVFIYIPSAGKVEKGGFQKEAGQPG